jgi:DNA adenine methylase
MMMTKVDEMQISAIAPLFGSKRTLAPIIVEELGEHHTYFEPFCGSMAVLLAKPKTRMETVCDLNGDLINLARVICHPVLGPKLYRQCRRLWMAEQMFREAAERWKRRGRQPAGETPDLQAAVDYFFTSWVGRNGVVGTKNYNQGFAARYTPGGGHGGTRWQSSVLSIPSWRHRMQDCCILNRCGFELIRRLSDEEGVAIYADPPYLAKGARYIFDDDRRPELITDEEWALAMSWAQRHATEDVKPERAAWHFCLSMELSRFKRARVVVSYYQHPMLKHLYPGWSVRSCSTTKAMVQGNGRVKGAVEAPEVLLLNGASFGGAPGGLFA